MILSEVIDDSETVDFRTRIHNVEEAVSVSRQVHEFCLQNGISTKKANLMSLFTEEMTTNVFLHAGNTKKGGPGNRLPLIHRGYLYPLLYERHG